MQTARQQTTIRITPAIKKEIVKLIDERIREVHVTKEDFSELKAIVREIVEVQKRTEFKVEELAEAQKELVEAQKRTELSIQRLADQQADTRTELSGLARSVSYSLENEAYRMLPGYLLEHYGIEVRERMVRLELEGEEINLFARSRKGGQEVSIVGEAELKLSSVGKLRHLEKKIALVRKHFPGDCIPLLITHFARPAVLEKAREKGIIVVQSFEW